MKFAPGTPPEVMRAAEEKALKTQQAARDKLQAGQQGGLAQALAQQKAMQTRTSPSTFRQDLIKQVKAKPSNATGGTGSGLGQAQDTPLTARIAGQVAAAKSKRGMAKGGAVKKMAKGGAVKKKPAAKKAAVKKKK